MISFVFNKQSAEWDVIGPLPEMVEGRIVSVTCRSGQEKKVTLGRVSKSFLSRFGPLQGKEVAIARVVDCERAVVPAGYYSRRGEILAKGCAECRRLGHMCPQCRHDFM